MTDSEYKLNPADHMGLAASLARSHGHTLDPSDAKGEAFLGLCEGCRTFDPTRGIKPSTFLRYAILARILRAVARASENPARCRTQAARKAFWRVEREARKLRAIGGVEPSTEALAVRIGVDSKDVERARAALSPVASLDSTGRDTEEGSSGSLMNRIGTSDPDLSSKADWILAAGIPLATSPVARDIVTDLARVAAGNEGEGWQAIADRNNMTRERVRQIAATVAAALARAARVDGMTD